MTHATVGESLVKKLREESWDSVRRWLEREHFGVLERINRLIVPDDAYRLDRVQDVLPPQNFSRMGYTGGHVSVWRALPQFGEIRPGDWVALNRGYAQSHQRGESGVVKCLRQVHPADVFWSGTDEFFYLPSAWRKQANCAQDYLAQLTGEQVRMLCDGEQASLTRHHEAIQAVRRAALEAFDADAAGYYHGPDHWARVSRHALAVARSLGEDPLVSHLFAWIHDTHRQDEGTDPEHGPRAADFILRHRDTLCAFLSDRQVEDLAHACRLHSDGQVNGPASVRACWDADRLDLWRVGVEPHPRYLCTSYAKDRFVIAMANHSIQASEEAVVERPALAG